MEGRKRPRSRVRITREQGLEIIRRARAWESRMAIAKEFGVSVRTIHRVVGGDFTNWYVPKPPKPGPYRPHRPRGGRLLTDGQVVELRRLRAAGATLEELSKRFRVDQSVVSRVARGLLYADVGEA